MERIFWVRVGYCHCKHQTLWIGFASRHAVKTHHNFDWPFVSVDEYLWHHIRRVRYYRQRLPAFIGHSKAEAANLSIALPEASDMDTSTYPSKNRRPTYSTPKHNITLGLDPRGLSLMC